MFKYLLFIAIFFIYLHCGATNPNTLNNAQHFLNKHPYLFQENKGQVTGIDADKVSFVYIDKGLSVFLQSNAITYQFSKTHYPKGYKHPNKFSSNKENERLKALQKKIFTETYRMDVCLVGANPKPKISTEGTSEDYIQYYNHDALNVHSFQKIIYHDVYPHIDWVIYQSNNRLKYDFIVHPGGNPNQILFETKWAEKCKVKPDGSLTLETKMGNITELSPMSYQNKKAINTQFVVNNNTYRFKIDQYNPDETLVIDPQLQWGTYYGGYNEDLGLSCTTDNANNVYLSGESDSGPFFMTSGGHQTYLGGYKDAFLVKFNAAGIRQWATFYGGGGEDIGNSCSTDPSGNVYLAGTTASSARIYWNGFKDTIGGNTDAFLVKFNTAGVRQWGTFYGGEELDYGYCCATDSMGNVYLCGSTRSTTGIYYGGLLNVYGGGNNDGFLVKFDSIGNRLWATYYGGNDVDNCFACNTDNLGNVYIAGTSSSYNRIAYAAHQTANAGWSDAFIAKFNSSGIRQWATFYGGTGQDDGWGCAVDRNGNAYLLGRTESTTNIAYSGFQNALSNVNHLNAFIVKFNVAGKRQWGTYYGNKYEFFNSGEVDNGGNLLAYGYTESNSNIAFQGYQDILRGPTDAMLVKFDSSGIRKWATYFGGSDAEYWGGVCAFDKTGSIYLSGTTSSTDFIAKNGYQNTNLGLGDAYLVKFKNCLPSVVTLNDTICNGVPYLFNGQNIVNSGTYIDTLANIDGCDSITTLNLQVNESSSKTIIDSICANNYYLFNGRQIAVAGVYKDTLVNAAQCDSIVTLILSIKPTSSKTTKVTICDGSYYTFNGQQLTQPGTYRDTLVNSFGCDSFVTLTLSIVPYAVRQINASICAAGIYNFNGHYLSQAGTYVDTLSRTTGCDSIITLILSNDTIRQTFIYDTICEGDSYSFNGQTLSLSGTYIDTIVKNGGCDSIVTIHLALYSRPQPTILKAGSILTTQIFNSYQWMLNGLPLAGANAQSLTALVNGEYSVHVKDKNGCEQTTNPINISNVGIDDLSNSNSNFLIYPNPTSTYLRIHSTQNSEYTAKVVSVNGDVITQFSFINYIQLNTENWAQGMYLLTFRNKDGYTINYPIAK